MGVDTRTTERSQAEAGSAEGHVRVLLLNASFNRVPFDLNKGAESIVIGTMLSVKEYFPQAEFSTFMHCSPAAARSFNLILSGRRKPSMKTFSAGDAIWWAWACAVGTLGRVLGRRRWKRPPFLRSKIVEEYLRSDIVLHLGMDQYSDPSGTWAIAHHSMEVLLGVLLRKPVVMFAESIGPFQGKVNRALARFTMRRVPLITLREGVSQETLRSLGVEGNVTITACPAFLLEPPTEDERDAVMEAEGIQSDEGLVIGLCPSWTSAAFATEHRFLFSLQRAAFRLGLYLLPESAFRLVLRLAQRSFAGSGPRAALARYVSESAATVDAIIESLPGTRILLIPFVYTDNPISDRELAEEIHRHVRHQERVGVIRGSHTVEAARAAIGQCHLFVGEKLHACIAALSQVIPSVGVAYGHKFRGVFDLLGQRGLVVDSYDPTAIAAATKKLQATSDQVRQRLQTGVNEVREAAMENARLAWELWRKGRLSENERPAHPYQ